MIPRHACSGTRASPLTAWRCRTSLLLPRPALRPEICWVDFCPQFSRTICGCHWAHLHLDLSCKPLACFYPNSSRWPFSPRLAGWCISYLLFWLCNPWLDVSNCRVGLSCRLTCGQSFWMCFVTHRVIGLCKVLQLPKWPWICVYFP